MMMMMKPLCCYAFSAFLSNLTQGKNRLSVFPSLSVSPHSKKSDVQKHPVNTLSPYLLLSFSLFCLLYFGVILFYCLVFRKRGENSGQGNEVAPKNRTCFSVFLTRSDIIPPTGFGTKGTIAFDHRREYSRKSFAICLHAPASVTASRV